MQSYFYDSFANSLAIASKVVHSVYVGIYLSVVVTNVDVPFNREGLAFHIVEGEKPAGAAIPAVSDSVVATELDFQICVINVLRKIAGLKNKKMSQVL